MRWLRKGFTLLETLITMATVAIVFGCFMLLLRDSMLLSRRSAAKEEGMRVSLIGLDRILSEAREACELVGVPTDPAAAASSLELLKVTATVEDRFPAIPTDFPTPQAARLLPLLALAHPEWALLAATAFSPLADDQVEKIRYSLDGEELIRLVGPRTGTLGKRLAIARGLTGFRCWQEPGSLLIVELTLLDAGRLRTTAGKVNCPCLDRNP